MTTLHLVNKSASNPAFARCLTMAAAGDNVLLIEDGVYNALPSALSAHRVEPVHLFVLIRDVEARGIASLLGTGFTLVDESGFVDLVVASQPIVSWS